MILYPYQEAGAQWLSTRRAAYLADPPGLGKTVTLLRGAQLLDPAGVVVICPAIVRPHWTRHATMMGFPAARVMSYEGAVKSSALGHDLVILDEAHYLKNPKAQRTRKILGKDGLLRKAPTVWFASGTPIVKSPADLWPVLCSRFPNVLEEHRLYTRGVFLDRFCVMRYNQWTQALEPLPGRTRNEEELRTLLRKTSLRRDYDEVGIELPPLLWTTQVITVEGMPEIEVPDSLRRVLDGTLTVEEALLDSSLARYRHAVGDAKAGAVAYLLTDEVQAGSREVVFAYHRSVLERLRFHFETHDIPVSYVDGDTPPFQRDVAIQRFQSGETKVFLGQQSACEVGVTLTAAHRVTLVEPSWTAVNNVQAGRRVARIGQTASACQVRMIALEDSLDLAVMERHRREAEMFDRIMDNRQDPEGVAA